MFPWKGQLQKQIKKQKQQQDLTVTQHVGWAHTSLLESRPFHYCGGGGVGVPVRCPWIELSGASYNSTAVASEEKKVKPQNIVLKKIQLSLSSLDFTFPVSVLFQQGSVYKEHSKTFYLFYKIR